RCRGSCSRPPCPPPASMPCSVPSAPTSNAASPPCRAQSTFRRRLDVRQPRPLTRSYRTDLSPRGEEYDRPCPHYSSPRRGEVPAGGEGSLPTSIELNLQVIPPTRYHVHHYTNNTLSVN